MSIIQKLLKTNNTHFLLIFQDWLNDTVIELLLQPTSNTTTTSDPSFVPGHMDHPVCLDIERNKLVQEYQNWGKEFTIEFDIVVNKMPNDWLNIFRVTSTNNDWTGKGVT